jgi:hypothetical protein
MKKSSYLTEAMSHDQEENRTKEQKEDQGRQKEEAKEIEAETQADQMMETGNAQDALSKL